MSGFCTVRLSKTRLEMNLKLQDYQGNLIFDYIQPFPTVLKGKGALKLGENF